MTGQRVTPGDARDGGHVGARARVDDIRRALAATADAAARARLRVRLADMLSTLGDSASAVAELKQAAVEAPSTAGLLLAVRFIVPQLTTDEAESLWAAVRPPRPAKRSAAPTVSGGRHRGASVERKPHRGSSKTSPTMGVTSVEVSEPVPVGPPPATLSMWGGAVGEPRLEPIDAAFAALAEKKPVLARRRGEEAARLAGSDGTGSKRLRELVQALDAHGAKRESLRLARTLAESGGGATAAVVGDALASAADQATEAGLSDWALRWNSDLGRMPPRAAHEGLVRDGDGTPLSARFRAAQRAAMLAGTADIETTIERFVPLIGGGAAVGAAALEFAERLTGALGAAGASRRAHLLRVAFEGERSARRRERLATRWVDALMAAGDSAGAVAVLERAIAELPDGRSVALRRTRMDLFRTMARDIQSARALAGDAEVSTGTNRLALLAEQADLLDRLGESDRALEVRLGGLTDAPGDLRLLVPARRRLEAVGRLDRSLALATAAVGSVMDRAARASLLRDVATLAEASSGDRERAAGAWLDVLALEPADAPACEAAERLLREAGDRKRLGELLAWAAARQPDAEARAALLWRLAEFRRVELQAPTAALTLYREIIEARRPSPDPLTFPEDDWQRRDNLLAVHTARAMAAPTTSARAQAIADRVLTLVEAGRLDDADRDIGRALDLDPAATGVMGALEQLHEQRGDWRVLRQRLQSRVEGAAGTSAAHLWFGIGRANERLGETAAARAAYQRAVSATDGFRLAVTALRQLAAARGDFAEVARLLEQEIELVTAPSVRVALLVELGSLLADKLNRAARAVEVLDAALASEPAHAGALDALFGAALGAGSWDKASQALDAMLAAGIEVPDAAQRYHRIGRAAEQAGQIDRALGLYSRSYARNPGFRPTLERLSEICFERQQWDNAWKATEHLVERHGADLDPSVRAALALRSALADLHVAQRFAALRGLGGHLGGPPSQAGLRDVAESWASMRFEPRLLGSVDGDRRARVLSRLGEVLSLTESAPTGSPAHTARLSAREALGALAVVDRRWADAVALLDGLGGEESLEARRRCLFLVAAGDVLLHQQSDVAGAALRYRRARALNPDEPRLARAGIIQVATDPSTGEGTRRG